MVKMGLSDSFTRGGWTFRVVPEDWKVEINHSISRRWHERPYVFEYVSEGFYPEP
jgi:hypothetical protein